MASYKFEYIWLDGYKPESMLRSKTKVLRLDNYDGGVGVLPDWSFDGSSTQQAEGHSSDCILKPVRVYPDTARINGYLVMCEVLSPDGTPHSSNMRATIKDASDEFWFGFEQEYVINEGGRPLGFPEEGYPLPQGPYYCSVGHGNVSGRELVEEHMDLCLEAGIEITGVNAEVMLGQWEFQVLSRGAKKAGDDLSVARYLLHRTAEQYGVTIDLHPKPVKGDWNGSGMHCNFSNEKMRTKGGKRYFENICKAFGTRHAKHIAVYGSDNEQRLTGLHETQSIEKFSFGVSDRGASIRIPVNVALTWKGYLEDRRPASNACPYNVAREVVTSVKLADKKTGGKKVTKKAPAKKAAAKKTTRKRTVKA